MSLIRCTSGVAVWPCSEWQQLEEAIRLTARWFFVVGATHPWDAVWQHVLLACLSATGLTPSGGSDVAGLSRSSV